MMRVALVSGEFPPNCGGIGVYTANLASSLLSTGNEVEVITRGVNAGIDLEDYHGVRVIRVFCPKIYPFHVAVQRLFVKDVCDFSSYDIINYQSPLVPVLHSRAKSISTFHSTVAGYTKRLQSEDVRSIPLQMTKGILYCYEKSVLRNSTHTISISEECKRELIDLYGISNSRITTIHNGVDTSFFIPENNNKKKSQMNLLYVGRVHYQKGIGVFIDAIERIIKTKRLSINCKIVGHGPDFELFNDIVRRKGLAEMIKFLGHIDNKDILRKLYQDCDVFVLPSYYEGVPTAMLEAMSCGKAVIATNVGGIPEIIENGKNGILISRPDAAKVEDSILSLADDQFVFDSLGRNAREFVVKNNDWNVIVKRILQIYIQT